MYYSKPRTVFGISLALVLHVAAAPAAESLTEIRALLNAGNAEAAWEALADAPRTGGDEAEFDFLRALAALNSARSAAALELIRASLERRPDDAAMQVLLGRALFAAGDYAAADAAFAAVAADQLPAAARDTIAAYREQIRLRQRVAQVTQWQAVVGVTGGFDTNANNATNESTVAVPVFSNLPFTLLESAQETSSGLLALDAGGEVRHRLNAQWQLHLSGFTHHTEYVDNDARRFDQERYQVAGGISYAFGRQQIRLLLGSHWFTVDNDLFRRTANATIDWQMQLDGRTRLNAYAHTGDVQFHPRSAQSVRDVTRWLGGAGVTRIFGRTQKFMMSFSLHGGVEDEQASAAPHIGRTLYGARIAPRWVASPRLSFDLNFLVEASDYGGQEPLFLRRRDDTYYLLGAGMRFQGGKSWFVEPAIRYVRNDSDIPTSDYDSLVGQVRLSYQFN